jgi:hypothetical protein
MKGEFRPASHGCELDGEIPEQKAQRPWLN